MRRMLQGRAGTGLAFLLGLLIATAGTATAAKLITGKQIKDGSISSKDLSNAVRAQLAKAGATGPKGEAGPTGAKGDPGPSAGPAAVEAWHEVGNGLTEPAFENGWSNGPNANEVTGAFYKDPYGVVHLKGLLTAGSNGTIFTLPAGYRPSKNLAQLVYRVGGPGLLFVLANGQVQAASSSGFTSIEGITFRAGE